MPLSCCCGKPIVNVVASPLHRVDRRDRDHRRDVQRPVFERAGDPRLGVGELERPDAGDPLAGGVLACRPSCRSGSRACPVGRYVPVNGAVPGGDRGLRRVVEGGIDEVRAGAPDAREQGDLRAVGRDQDRA